MRSPQELRQASHYPASDWPVVVLEKRFPAGTRTGMHGHERGQLLLVAKGFTVAKTTAGSWFVPPGYALWIPPDLVHDIAMHSDVVVGTAYVARTQAASLSSQCRVISVTALLEAALAALGKDQPSGPPSPRSNHLAWLIVDEISRAEATAFAVTLPRDLRLVRIAEALIAEPGSERTIDQWCELAGLSRRTLTRTFRQETGLSFGEWRARLRLAEAMTRVAEGETLARAAAKVGYRNVAAFRTMAARCGAAGLFQQR
jgi:AraC-like DNA-binding protein